MPALTDDVWLGSVGGSLSLIRDTGEVWTGTHVSAVFNHAGSEYRHPQPASEWLALTRPSDSRVPVGIFFDIVMFSDFVRWLSSGFDNVRQVGENAFHVILTEHRDFHEDGWPFLPC